MGVFRLRRGNWGYRVLVKDEDGITRNRRAVKDKFGKKITTKKDATVAMNEVICTGLKRRERDVGLGRRSPRNSRN